MANKSGFVSLIGRPNAGKSTLLNRLVGTKLAIVSDKPQTTRTRILGVKNYPVAQVVFVDTPGIHRPLHRMNVRMVDVAMEAMHEVDVLGLRSDSRRQELPGGAGGICRHAGDSPAAAPDERPDGRRRHGGDARSGRAGPQIGFSASRTTRWRRWYLSTRRGFTGRCTG